MVRILVPPGIGDIYWTLVKLQAFMRSRGLSDPELTIVSWKGPYDGHLRSIPFLNMIPFISVGNPPSIPNVKKLQPVYQAAYNKKGHVVHENFMGYDFFITYNGHINDGGWLEDADDLECNWYLPEMIVSEEQKKVTEEAKAKYGRYFVCHWPFYGSYIPYHVKEFPFQSIVTVLKKFVSNTELTPVFVGAPWDMHSNKMLETLIGYIPRAVNLVGKTTLDQAFGLVKGSELFVGYHNGLANMTVVFRKNVVLLWSDIQFPRSTALACVPPETRNTTYRPLYTNGLTKEQFYYTMWDLWRSGVVV